MVAGPNLPPGRCAPAVPRVLSPPARALGNGHGCGGNRLAAGADADVDAQLAKALEQCPAGAVQLERERAALATIVPSLVTGAAELLVRISFEEIRKAHAARMKRGR